MHQSHQLFEEMKVWQRQLQDTGKWPRSVAPISGDQWQGRSFFPPGVGLSMDQSSPLPTFPVHGIMVLGHDWGTFAEYGQDGRGGREADNSTWRNLTDFLKAVEVDAQDCFFTNYYMGLRAEPPSTGRHPASRDKCFVKACGDFLVKQVEVLKPKLIMVLGGQIPGLLPSYFDGLDQWAKFNKFGAFDQAGCAVVVDVKLRKLDVFSGAFNVVLLTHPSMRKSNVGRRKYSDASAVYSGHDAEVKMISAAKGCTK